MSWLYLFLAIIFETVGTTFLKLSNGFSVLSPSIYTIVGYALCFYFLSVALKSIDISIAYAIWCAIGIVLITLIGVFFFHENMSFAKILFLLLIIVGTIGLRLIK